MEVTIGRVMNLAAKAGLPKPARAYPAMALGTSEATPLQVASAYTGFRNARNTHHADRNQPHYDRQRRNNRRADTAEKRNAASRRGLRDDFVHEGRGQSRHGGAGSSARIKGNVAGKTGTSRDGWFAGYTPNLVCVVWVGFDDGSQLGLTGANSALPIWTDFMEVALGRTSGVAGRLANAGRY